MRAGSVVAPGGRIAHHTEGGGITHCGIKVTRAWAEATAAHRRCKRCF